MESKKDTKSYTVSEILEMALKREKASYQFYDKIIKNISVNTLVETIEQLREEEYKHIKIIEKKIAGLGL